MDLHIVIEPQNCNREFFRENVIASLFMSYAEAIEFANNIKSEVEKAVCDFKEYREKLRVGWTQDDITDFLRKSVFEKDISPADFSIQKSVNIVTDF